MNISPRKAITIYTKRNELTYKYSIIRSGQMLPSNKFYQILGFQSSLYTSELWVRDYRPAFSSKFTFT